jgi:hypothetical protein
MLVSLFEIVLVAAAGGTIGGAVGGVIVYFIALNDRT